MNDTNCFCIICSKPITREMIYATGMYRFCTEKCYQEYRKLDSQEQLVRQHIDHNLDRKSYQQTTL